MRVFLVLVTLATLVTAGCLRRVNRTVTPPDALHTVDDAAPFLKVHMHDGSLYVLSPWVAHEAEGVVTGTGTRYGLERNVTEEGGFSIALDEVALFETNVTRSSPSVAALAVITGIRVQTRRSAARLGFLAEQIFGPLVS